jgi:hypothetical protein
MMKTKPTADVVVFFEHKNFLHTKRPAKNWQGVLLSTVCSCAVKAFESDLGSRT